MQIDILIGVASQGGVENVIKKLLLYFEKRNDSIRVIQLVWEGEKWLENDKKFFPLLKNKKKFNLTELCNAYTEFLTLHNTPDVILATAWPYMSYIAKKSSISVNKNILVISWLHAPIHEYECAGYGSYKELAYADAHFAINESICKNLVQTMQKKPVFRVYNPISFDPTFRRNINSSHSAPRKNLVFIGRISEEKGIETILNAISKISHRWSLTLIGDGEQTYLESLKMLEEKLQIKDDLTWLGWQEDPWAFVTNATDFLILSSYYEGSPLVTIEALSRGIPIISTPVNGVIDYLTPGKNGYLFPFEDADSLSSILLHISNGSLPIPDGDFCRQSVIRYNTENACADFRLKMKYLLRKKNSASEVCHVFSTYDYLYCDKKISAIVPCYCVEKYISRCLEHILNQTFPLSMIEIILVDDASTDHTREILLNYEKKYPEQIVLLLLDDNKGLGYARNLGMHYASGDYIYFVDSDDYPAENAFQEMFDEMELTDADMVAAGYTQFNDYGDKMQITMDNKLYQTDDNLQLTEYILKYGCQNSAWGKLYRHDFINKYNISFPQNIKMEDIAFYEDVFMHAHSIKCLSVPLYFYYQNPNGIMYSSRIDNYYMDEFYVQKDIYHKLTKEENIKKRLNNDNKLRMAFELIYYVKGVNAPLCHIIEKDSVSSSENVSIICSELARCFPDIDKNIYILSDTTQQNLAILNIIRKNWPYFT